MRVRWTRRAKTQLCDAITYLEEHRPGAGLGLHEEVRALLTLVRSQPRSFPRVPGVVQGEVRRGLLVRYGYWLIFEIVEDSRELIVLALWHARQRPLGWKV